VCVPTSCSFLRGALEILSTCSYECDVFTVGTSAFTSEDTDSTAAIVPGTGKDNSTSMVVFLSGIRPCCQ
jgi:hypothetical protein